MTPRSDSIRHRIYLWFFIVVLLLVLAGTLAYREVSGNMSDAARQRTALSITHVRHSLETTNALYLDLTHASMRLLKERTNALGQPRIGLPVHVADRLVPNLSFGSRALANDFEILDAVKDLMGGTATLFVRAGEDFVRISTNVRTPDGGRAVGTILDPDGAAIAAIRRNEVFSGQVDILGKSYVTSYEPIHDAAGATIGIWYTGYPVETLTTLEQSISDVRILDHGFVAVFDSKGTRMFASRHAPESALNEVAAAASQQPTAAVFRTGDWSVDKTSFAPWNYTILAATWLPDIRVQTRHLVDGAFSTLGLVVLLVLLASYWSANRLSDALRQAGLQKAEAEAARSAAEAANRTKSAFLANMSHELRTPMNAIIGYSEMLLEEAEDTGQEALAADLRKIQGAGKHLLGLINDVLDLSKIEAGKMTLYLESFDVRETLDAAVSTIRPLLDTNKNTLTIDCAPDLGQMRADLTKVRQTLLNLLSNATKFTHEGTITLTARKRPGDRVEFVVADTGIGMNEAQLGRLFQSFSQADESTTRRYGGTGLGLAISLKFCEMMGGTIGVTSEPGRGTTFTVSLPIDVGASTRHEPATSTQPVELALPADAGKPVILVIDDDPSVHDLVGRTLAKEGFEIVTASSGREGLEKARQCRPAAITLDIMMPGMDGWEVLSALKADRTLADIPVVVMTIVDDKETGFALGATDYMTKPVQLDRLAALLARFRPEMHSSDVLIVEDEPDTRELLERALRKEGWNVEVAENGRVALDRISTRRPALILLDLMMPEMDGFEFLHRLRGRDDGVGIPVIVLTAKDLTEEDHARLGGQVQRILEKTAVLRTRLLADIQTLIKSTRSRTP